MKLIAIVLGVATALVALFSQSTSHASTRARTPAETVLLDSAPRIALGSAHTCQVNADGTARCWGDNSEFQVSPETFNDQLTPVPVVTLSTSGPVRLTGIVAIAAEHFRTCFLIVGGTVRCTNPAAFDLTSITNAVAIAAGSDHACAVLASGGARCWGENLFGRLGDGTGNDSRTPVTVRNLTNAVAMAAGFAHTCALLADGSVSCWGLNSSGQLGDGTFTGSPIPVAVTGLTNAVAIAAGSNHTCALLASGSARCWGADGSGQLGNGTAPNDPRIPGAVTGLTNAVAIAAGGSHTCALLANGTARCWGLNTSGQLGDDTTTTRLSPVAVRNLTSAVAIAVGKGLAGDSHTCALLADGSARCWGANGSGRLGDGTTSRKLTPSTVSGGGGSVTARDVAAGSGHTCAVRANSTVACWGLNSSGQLGDGTTTTTRLTPTAVPGLVNAVAIAAGSFHTCVLVSDGNVRCWGDNQFGQLGDGGASGLLSRVPVSVSGLANAVAIAAGHEHTCALLADGTARCWGDNSIGQLGDGSTNNRSTPGPLPAGNLGNVTAIAPGRDHTCALLASGVARCWGLNSSGQLGNGSFNNSFTPVVVALSNAVAVSAGHFHSCALQADGAARCWGRNANGELGIGSTTNQSTPIAGSLLANAVAIAPGVGHTCALVAGGGLFNGTARCWGDNSVGQLGNINSTSLSLVPVVVGILRCTFACIFAPLTGIANITTGGRHSCALLVTGGVSCWGDNSSGQLGNNSTTNQFGPVGVPSFTLNIDPSVVLKHNDRVSTVTILATCEAGQRLHVEVAITQGAASGRGVGVGKCTGGLERYPVTVPAHGRDGFIEGAAQVSAEALIRERGLVVDTQEWTRVVEIDSAP